MQRKDWEDRIAAWRDIHENRRGPMGLAELARLAIGLAELAVGHSVAASEAKGEPVSCRKGCGDCCRQVIPLSPAEILSLQETRAGLPWDRRAETDERLDRMRATLTAAGLDGVSLLANSREVFALGLTCPFLSEDACSIHPDRPLVCREHLAISPREYCGEHPHSYVHLLSPAFSVRDALSRVAAQALAQAPEAVPMARLPEWLLANGHLAERVWDAADLLDGLAAQCNSQLAGLP